MEMGKDISVSVVKKDDSGLWAPVYDYFRSWDEAIVTAREDMDFKDALSRVGVKTGCLDKQMSQRETSSTRRT